jgi:hypothetical protein
MLRIDNAPGVVPAIENRVNELPGRAKISPTIHATVARAIWPDKTAENWAAAAGKEPSVGKVWLRGNVSGDAKLALIRLLG